MQHTQSVYRQGHATIIEQGIANSARISALTACRVKALGAATTIVLQWAQGLLTCGHHDAIGIVGSTHLPGHCISG